MSRGDGIRDFFRERLERYRFGLASSTADGFLALLGLLTGLIAGFTIVGFRVTVDAVQQLYLSGQPAEAFETLDPALRVLLPLAGGLLLGVMFRSLPPGARTVGIVHVLERLEYHQGYMPIRNFLVQFVGGALALATGQSVGREAPSVHLGAGAGSLLGRRLQVPNNTLRTLVACGSAAAIAASFNTPLAGVVFAMELIMVEYTIAGFVPVILAAVAATVVTHLMIGTDSTFVVELVRFETGITLLYVTVMGGLLGAASAAFVRAVRSLGRVAERLPVVLRMTLAGAVVGLLGLVAPEILGLGYDTVDRTLAGHVALDVLLVVFIAKFLASATCIATRIPGGLIGPAVFMGCLFGAAFADVISLLPGADLQADWFAVLGMAAMMGAVLQAPLAALVALLEMTASPYVIMPAMLAVVSAALTARIVFSQESVFTLQMRDAGLDHRHDPVSQGLRRVGVAAVMNRAVQHAERHVDRAAAGALLATAPQWIIVSHEHGEPLLLRAADLARYLEDTAAVDDADDADAGTPADDIDLIGIPAERLELRPVHLQATLFEAREIMTREGVAALYVRRPQAPEIYRTFGIVLRADLEVGYAVRA